MTLDFSVWLFLAWMLVCMPVLGVLSYYRVKSGKPLPPKRRRFVTTMVAEVLTLDLALYAAPRSLVLFPRIFPDAEDWIFTAIILCGFVLGVARGVSRLPAERRRSVRVHMPEDPPEFRAWAAVPLLAGVCEEIAYRGVLYRLLTDVFHSPIAALVVAVIAFAAAHAAQGFRATLGIAGMAVGFHIIVALTGTLYVAIAVHVIYDYAVGFLLMKSLYAESREAATATP